MLSLKCTEVVAVTLTWPVVHSLKRTFTPVLVSQITFFIGSLREKSLSLLGDVHCNLSANSSVCFASNQGR